MRRVVITGMGALTPFGLGVDLTWKSLLDGKSGITNISKFDAADYSAQIAGEIIMGKEAPLFDPDTVMEPKDQRRVDDFILYGLGAANEAIRDAAWMPEDEQEKCRTGVAVGSGIGGLKTIYATSQLLATSGPKRINPFFIPSSIINMASGHVSMKYGFKGPNLSNVTACATGAHAVIHGYQAIVLGDADVMISGGAESAIYPLAVGGFMQARALSHSYNDRPQEASRPWDKGHDGFVMSEGAGVLVLEEYEHAIKRGAKIYAEVVGYGCSGDAYHITSPAPDGNGAKRAMSEALKKAGMRPEEIDYINAHGTSTMVGDAMEAKAVRELFGKADNLKMSSTKSALGHMLGAAGAVETIVCAKAIESGIVPPTLNLHDPIDEAEGLDLVPNKAVSHTVKAAMTNSFGFGGTNASIILRKI
ncbi:MAG: beta-ketoacyl-ACP synthase II [Alphaproteobacteria bacterium]|nr:beta-ketoacyl-ACP synthase II [Alphaproteobacteria bacterium]